MHPYYFNPNTSPQRMLVNCSTHTAAPLPITRDQTVDSYPHRNNPTSQYRNVITATNALKPHKVIPTRYSSKQRPPEKLIISHRSATLPQKTRAAHA